MAITHPTAVRNAIADLVVDSLDAGSGTAAGRLKFRTAADADVATLTFSNPAFGSASSGSATANAITSDTNAAGGVVAKFVCIDRDSTTKIQGAVAVSGGDINISSLTISPGDTVSIASLVYTSCP
jgi:hypothetical protein